MIVAVSRAAPQLLGVLLVEAQRGVRAVELDPGAFLAAGGDLTHGDRPERARVGLEEDHGRVLGRHRTRRRRWPCGGGEGAPAAGAQALGNRGQQPRRQARDPVARDELRQVAPVRADVGERPRAPPSARVDAPVVVVGRSSQSCR